MSIRVLLVDDHMIMRHGIKALLDNIGDISVIADAENGSEALRLAGELHPDVVVVDISLPDISGIEVTRRIKAEMYDISVLALTMHSCKEYIVEILGAGASGFLSKNCTADELGTAIRVVKSGKTYLSPSIAGMIFNSRIRQEQTHSDYSCSLAKLTPREKETLTLFAEGMSTKEIAFHFGLSIKTIESHRKNIMCKLQLFNIADLTRFAIRQGLSSLF